MNTCKNCHYFNDEPIRRYSKDESASHHEEGTIMVADGRCARLPKWEEVNEEHSCGEFKIKGDWYGKESRE